MEKMGTPTMGGIVILVGLVASYLTARLLFSGFSAMGASLVLVAAPVGLAAAHTVPAAVRLGAQTDPPDRRAGLARSIWRDHLLCFSGIASLLVLQLVFGR
jgi:hypothetical protein